VYIDWMVHELSALRQYLLLEMPVKYNQKENI